MMGVPIFLTDPVQPGLFYKHLYHSLIHSLGQSLILSENIFKTPSLPGVQGDEILREDHLPPLVTCYVSHVMCHESHVTYHMSHVTGHNLHVILIFYCKVVKLVTNFFQSQKNFSHKIFLVTKIFQSQIFLSQNFFSHKKFLVTKNFSTKKTLVTTIFSHNKILDFQSCSEQLKKNLVTKNVQSQNLFSRKKNFVKKKFIHKKI